jgi:hypothetical protein
VQATDQGLTCGQATAANVPVESGGEIDEALTTGGDGEPYEILTQHGFGGNVVIRNGMAGE